MLWDVREKKDFFFIRYFYRWETIAICLFMGIITLWFYFHALKDICGYPFWLPVGFFIINVCILIGATIFIRRPGKPQTKMRIHSGFMLILLIINPALLIAFSETFMSILWTLSIATYLLYCLLFVRYSKYDVFIAGIPFATFLIHLIVRIMNGTLRPDLFFLALFGFLMSLFYGLFYFFFKFCLDNANESLSVYLDNKDIEEFLRKYNLTDRERETCFCIINGYSAKKIGEKLGISEGTVKNHTKSVYKKMGINGRMELMHLIWDFTLLQNP